MVDPYAGKWGRPGKEVGLHDVETKLLAAADWYGLEALAMVAGEAIWFIVDDSIDVGGKTSFRVRMLSDATAKARPTSLWTPKQLAMALSAADEQNTRAAGAAAKGAKDSAISVQQVIQGVVQQQEQSGQDMSEKKCPPQSGPKSARTLSTT